MTSDAATYKADGAFADDASDGARGGVKRVDRYRFGGGGCITCGICGDGIGQDDVAGT